MSNSKWFRVIAGICSVAFLIYWLLLRLNVLDTPSLESVAQTSVLAMALVWGVMAGLSK